MPAATVAATTTGITTRASRMDFDSPAAAASPTLTVVMVVTAVLPCARDATFSCVQHEGETWDVDCQPALQGWCFSNSRVQSYTALSLA